MAEKKKQEQEEDMGALVRILSYDIPGDKNIYTGLTKIKGVSWSISNVICKLLSLDKSMKIGQLTDKDIEKIEKTVENIETLKYLKNRRSDLDTGKDLHIIGTNLDMRKEFDVKRMKQIRSYKGVRHSLKQPVRGQRTRSHFRTTGVAVGVKKPKTGKKG